MWFLAFCISLSINLVMFFYIRWLLNSIAVINEDVNQLSIIVQDFGAHVKSIYELEMFYGDETLESLMKHANEVSEKLENLDLIINDDEEKESNIAEEETEAN